MMVTYADPETGLEIRRYTEGPGRNSKLYFTTENFTADDKFFFFNRQTGDGGMPTGELVKCDPDTGECQVMAGGAYRGFAMDRQGNFGVMVKEEGDRPVVCRLDCDTGDITQLGALPEGGKVTGHLTTADTGLVACSYHQANKIFALVTLDPKTGKSEVVYESDYHLGHAQICPTDENLIFYIHETMGDALQRTWMYDVKHRRARPYYVEHPNEWITHEVWSADGTEIAFMKLHGHVLVGDKDGRRFDEIGWHEQLLHPCFSRDKRWICADRTSYLGVTVRDGIVLMSRATGESRLVASTGAPKTGADHQHPSFDRSGKRILFCNPDADGTAQVCMVHVGEFIA